MKELCFNVNGTEVCFCENRNLHSFCVAIYINAGSLYETEENNGISHLYEHAVFRNLKTLFKRDLYELLSENGIYLDACTYKEFVQFSVSGDPEGFPLAADIISKILLPPTMSIAELDTEKRRIRAEIAEDDEFSSIDYINGMECWQDTPPAMPITGKWSTVKAISRKRLAELRDEIISAGNFFVYATGNIGAKNRDLLLSAVESIPLGSGMRGSDDCHPDGVSVRIRNNTTPIPEDFCSRNGEVTVKASDSTLACISFDADFRRFSHGAVGMLYSALFMRDDSAVNQALSEETGAIYSYSAPVEEYRNAGRFWFRYEVPSEADLYPSLEAAGAALKKIKDGGFSVDLCRRKYHTGWVMDLDNPENLNWMLAYETRILGLENPDFSRPLLGKYDGVTREDVLDAARGILDPKNMVLTLKGRRKTVDADRARDILMAALK